MERTEKSIVVEEIFKGKVITVERHQVVLEAISAEDKDDRAAQHSSVREIVHHPGGVCVLAINEEGKICLVQQYRKAVEAVLLELPAGKRESGEDTLLTARRELQEETGYQAKKWHFLGEMLATPGYCDETIYLYLAMDLVAGKQNLDEGEFLSVHWYPWEDVEDMIRQNLLRDGKTKLAFLLAKDYLRLRELNGDKE